LSNGTLGINELSMDFSSWAIQELSGDLKLEMLCVRICVITMYCTVIHCVAYEEDSFITELSSNQSKYSTH
jgi:hypothetical protein